MALKSIVDFYDYLIVQLQDERSKDYFLISSPIPMLLILICYVYFVTNLGPRLMKNRQPFDLRNVMIVYNLAQIVVNSVIFIQAWQYCWGGHYNWLCEPIDWTVTPFNLYVVRVCYAYFLVKLWDLLDTIFMVLRKKEDHISFLHVYHHTGMCALAWGGVKYLPGATIIRMVRKFLPTFTFSGGHGTFLGFINTFVHAVMYGYYLFSSLNPNHSEKIWWKKYLTQLQMAQFLMVALHTLLLLFQPNCNYPKFIVFLLTPQNMFMFILFCDFYQKTYCKPKTTIKSKNNNQKVHSQ